MKNYKFKNKKGWIGICLLLGILFAFKMPCAAKEVKLKSDTYREYQYQIGGQIFDLTLYYDDYSEDPIYQLEADKYYMNQYDYEVVNHKYSYLNPLIYDAVYLATDGSQARERNKLNRMAMQLYLYELYAKENNLTFKILFDDTQIRKIQQEILSQAADILKVTHYNYTLNYKEWNKIENYDWASSRFNLANQDNLEFRNVEWESFEVFPNTMDKSSVTVDLKAEYKEIYEAEGKPTYLKIFYLQRTLPILDFEVVDNKDYNITVNQTKGINVLVKEKAKALEEVTIEPSLEKGYSLDNILVTTVNGDEISLEDNKFIMPHEDVVIKPLIKENLYNIQIIGEHVSLLGLRPFKYNEEVYLSYKVDDGYEIGDIHIETVSGKEIEMVDNLFRMPDEDVIIKVQTKKIEPVKYQVIKEESIHGNYEVSTKLAKEGEIVKIKPQADEGYVLDEIKVYQNKLKNKELVTLNDDNSFVMPDSDVLVVVTFKREEKEYSITIKDTINGKITIDTNKVLPQRLVNMVIEANTGYVLRDLVIIDENNKKIDYTKEKEKVSFEMPSSNVVVEATFEKINLEKHLVTVNLDEGVTLEVLDSYEAKKIVKIQPVLQEGYEIEKIKIETVSNKKINLDNKMSFEMPNEDVVITIKTKKIVKYYKVNVISDDKVLLNILDSYKAGEIVKIEPVVEEGYEIESIVMKFGTNKTKIYPLLNFEFEMPLDDVTLEVTTKKVKYNVEVLKSDGVTINILDNLEWGKEVKLDLLVDKLYRLDEIKIITKSGKEILVKDNQFIMPKEDIIISSKSTRIYYYIYLASYDKTLNSLSPLIYPVNSRVSLPYRNTYNQFIMSSIVDFLDNDFIMPSYDLYITYFKVTSIKEAQENFGNYNDPTSEDGYYTEYCLDDIVNKENDSEIELIEEHKEVDTSYATFFNIPNTGYDYNIFNLGLFIIGLIYVKKRFA